MPKTEKISSLFFEFLVLVMGIGSLVLCTVIAPASQNQSLEIILLALFVFVLEFFPFDLHQSKFYLVQAIVFSGGILYGTGVSGWAYFLGITAALILQIFLHLRSQGRNSNLRAIFINASQNLGLNLLPLILVLLIWGLSEPIDPFQIDIDQNMGVILGAGLSFGLVHGLIYASSASYLNKRKIVRDQWDYLALISIELLPLILGFVTILTFPILKTGSIIALGIISILLALLLHYLSAPRKDLERRILELSTLDQISKALSSDIDLEMLLSAIQVEVTNLLNVDNFYVALLDSADGQIWYPLAVKNGIHQNWSRRPLTNRLTDRVILESKSILLPRDAGQQLTRIGLPSDEDAPFAWIGVPIITSEKAIGCLALFSLTPEVEFTENDLNILSILSGQTSVAIEIALHNALLSSDITTGRDRLTSVLNSVRDGIVLLETDGRITLLNEAVQSLTGLPQSEFIGKEIKDLPPSIIQTFGFTVQQAEELLEQFDQDQVTSLVKITFKVEDKSPLTVIERSIFPVLSQSESPAGWIILLRDITDEYQAQEARDLINETLVHDLRSPLSSTISALDVIHDSIGSGDPAGIVEPSIQIAQRSARRVLTMVESILEINRMESGKFEINLSDEAVEPIVDQTIAEFTNLAQQYKVSIVKNMPEGLPLVRLDRGKIHRVLTNLIDNAVKFTPESGQILVSAGGISENYIEICVSDTGPGIPEEYRQKIFERFIQVPGLRSRRRGSGLGLTYCQLAIQAHKGRIWVEESPDGGSTFVFTLPIHGPGEPDI
jgi:NtrC-family two-component system sensor histidine kinase KinB